MKKIAAIVIAISIATSLLQAHEMEGGSTSGLFGLKADYIHVLLNPLPVYGLSMGVLVLAAGLVTRNRSIRNAGLAVVLVCAASAWPVLFYGQHGYNHLYDQLDTDSQQWLDVPMSRAERFIYIFYAAATTAVIGIVCSKRFPKIGQALSLATLLTSAAGLGVGAWISRAGGEVSHSEFRNEGSVPEAPAHEHHHAARQLDQIHADAEAVKQLTAALVLVVHLDHKASVQAGADKIKKAVSNMHKSAHAEDAAGVNANFKLFEEALTELQE